MKLVQEILENLEILFHSILHPFILFFYHYLPIFVQFFNNHIKSGYMSKKFPEYKSLDLSAINKEIQGKWEKENTFERSISSRDENKPFIFYEGPPSANGKPGIHHVISRTIKDIICRYKSLEGYRVDRKAGWD